VNGVLKAGSGGIDRVDTNNASNPSECTDEETTEYDDNGNVSETCRIITCED